MEGRHDLRTKLYAHAHPAEPSPELHAAIVHSRRASNLSVRPHHDVRRCITVSFAQALGKTGRRESPGKEDSNDPDTLQGCRARRGHRRH
jgi:hypothetical protein